MKLAQILWLFATNFDIFVVFTDFGLLFPAVNGFPDWLWNVT